MSSYARLRKFVASTVMGAGENLTLEPGTRIRNVEHVVGAWEFEAYLDCDWVHMLTMTDLPSCTDKTPRGRGRPESSPSKTTGFRFTDEQHKWLERKARGKPIASYVKRLLKERGMP